MNEYHMKLPRGKAEFIVFLLIVSIVSVNIIAPVITFLELDFSTETYLSTLKSIPFIWLAVVALVLITYKPAKWLTNKILKRQDSFNAHILVTILCTVFMMSIVLTIIAPMIATCSITVEPLKNFIYAWPRNFTIAFGVELLIAQPLARAIMNVIHKHKDKKTMSNTGASTDKSNENHSARFQSIFDKESDDEIFVQALQFAIENDNVSISSLQRKYAIGYNRARRMVEKMEELGYISEPKGETFKRTILITQEEFDNIFGNNK